MIVIDDNKQVFEQSKWATYNGSKFLIAPASNLQFQRIFNRLQIPHRKKIEKSSLDPKITQEITIQSLAEAILLNWDDVVDATGKIVPYTVELGVKTLTKHIDLREFIQEFALELENFKIDDKTEMGEV